MTGAIQGSGASQGTGPVKKTVSKEVTTKIDTALGKKVGLSPTTETKITEVSSDQVSGVLEGVPHKVEASLTASAMENVQEKKESELGGRHSFKIGGSDKKTGLLFKKNIP